MSQSAQALRDPFRDLRQRRRQCRAVVATALRHVRTPAALAVDLTGDMPEQFPGLDLASRGTADACDQGCLARRWFRPGR